MFRRKSRTGSEEPDELAGSDEEYVQQRNRLLGR